MYPKIHIHMPIDMVHPQDSIQSISHNTLVNIMGSVYAHCIPLAHIVEARIEQNDIRIIQSDTILRNVSKIYGDTVYIAYLPCHQFTSLCIIVNNDRDVIVHHHHK